MVQPPIFFQSTNIKDITPGFCKFHMAYDSLGEAFMKTGEKDLAIKNYEKSLELNPNNDNAKKMLENLRKK